MKKLWLLFLITMNISCSIEDKRTINEEGQNDANEVIEVSLITDSTLYSIKVNDSESYWDSTYYNGSLKSKILQESPHNISLIDLEIPGEIEKLIDSQRRAGMKKLLEWYKLEGMTNDSEVKKESRKIYSNPDSLILIYDKYTVNFEYAEIAILTVWRKDKFAFTYSDQTKLGVNIEITGSK